MSESVALVSLFLSSLFSISQLGRVRDGLQKSGGSWSQLLGDPSLLREPIFWQGKPYDGQCPPEITAIIPKLKKRCQEARDLLVSSDSGFEIKGQRPIRLLTYLDPDYPPLLSQMSDRPLILTLASRDLSLATARLSSPLVAMVGTRRMTSYGRYAAKTLASQLVASRVGVVSGLMYGVDQEAQLAAVRAGGLTVAVLGHGLNCIPTRDSRVVEELWRAGAVFVSEFLPDFRACKWTFVARNRIIAGLSLATIVVEAAARSGSLITAKYALFYDREVGAVPGQITSPFSRGTQELINQGATLINTADDLLSGLRQSGRLETLIKRQHTNPGHPQANSLLEQQILTELAAASQSTDQLLISLKIDPQNLLTALTDLEIAGLITQTQNRWMIQ